MGLSSLRGNQKPLARCVVTMDSGGPMQPVGLRVSHVACQRSPQNNDVNGQISQQQEVKSSKMAQMKHIWNLLFDCCSLGRCYPCMCRCHLNDV